MSEPRKKTAAKKTPTRPAKAEMPMPVAHLWGRVEGAAFGRGLHASALLLDVALQIWNVMHARSKKSPSDAILATWLECGEATIYRAREELVRIGRWKTTGGGGFKKRTRYHGPTPWSECLSRLPLRSKRENPVARAKRMTKLGPVLGGKVTKLGPVLADQKAPYLNRVVEAEVPPRAGSDVEGAASTPTAHPVGLASSSTADLSQETFLKLFPNAKCWGGVYPEYWRWHREGTEAAQRGEATFDFERENLDPSLPDYRAMWVQVQEIKPRDLSPFEREWITGQQAYRKNGREKWDPKEVTVLKNIYRQKVQIPREKRNKA